MIKVLVCGGRDFTDEVLICSTLGKIHKEHGISVIVHGGASGADCLASVFAEKNGISTERYPANWQKHGKAAGPIRNKYMLNFSKPDIVVAFDGGKGTANMVSLANKDGVPVFIVTKNGMHLYGR